MADKKGLNKILISIFLVLIAAGVVIFIVFGPFGTEEQPVMPEPIVEEPAQVIPPPATADLQKMQTMGQQVITDYEFPKGTKILISFFDGNGELMPEKYLLTENGVVAYNGEDYDAELSTGYYYLDDLKADFCGTMKKANEAQDARFEFTSVLKALKYAGLKSELETCLGTSLTGGAILDIESEGSVLGLLVLVLAAVIISMLIIKRK